MLILNDSRCGSGQSWDTILKKCVPNGTKAATRDSSGNVVPGAPPSSGGGSSPSAPSGTVSASQQAQLNSLLSNTSLSADERTAISAVFNSIVAGDAAAAQQMMERLNVAIQFADPMLARQIKLMTAELEQTVQGMDQDLAYNEQKIINQRNDLQEDIAYNRDQLTIQEQADLRKLDNYYGEQLIQTRDTMAARGLGDSRKRYRAEEILAQQKGDMVEGTQREFAARQRDLTESGERSARDTAAELERLRQLTENNKDILALRATEQLGSNRAGNLGALGGTDILGGIEGQVDLTYRDTLADFAF